jgi:hypothetical protein
MHEARRAGRRRLRKGGEHVRAFLIMVKREIGDHSLLFLGALAVVAIYVFYVTTRVFVAPGSPPIGVPPIMHTLLLSFLPWLAVTAAGVGAVQMRSDLRSNTCAFLATTATTRRRVLGAKLVAGLLWISVLVVPVALTDCVLLMVFPRLVWPDISLLARVLAIFLLSCLSGYAVGLDAGMGERKLVTLSAIVVLVPLLLSVILVKGLSLTTAVVLSLVAAACLARVWTRFVTIPL